MFSIATRLLVLFVAITQVNAFGFALSKSAADVSRERITAAYASVAKMTAEVEQIKEGRYLARPLKSQSRLVYTPASIEWITLSPVASKVIIDGQGLKVVMPDGAAAPQPGAANNPKIGALIGFLRAMIALDFAKLEKDFALVFTNNKVIATVLPSSPLSFMKKLTVEFDNALKVSTLLIESERDKSLLTFREVVIEKR